MSSNNARFVDVEPADAISEQDVQKTHRQIVDDIVAHIQSNHANALPFCACLETCCNRMPYRQAEDCLNSQLVMDTSLQNAHALIAIMLQAGAIRSIPVDEPQPLQNEQLQDQPTDYLLETTEAGKDALAQFEPLQRFRDLIESEPAIYAQAYRRILDCCQCGSKLSDIEQMLKGNEALVNPKLVYPQYFVSKLETIGGLVWDDSWNTTAAGTRMLAVVE